MFAKFWWPLTVALISLCLCLHVNASESDEENDIQLEHQESCPFYCFMLPQKKDSSESIKKNIDVLNDLNCTHLVYGYATIDHHQRVNSPNEHDLQLDAYWSNYRTLHKLHSQTHPLKLLLGIREEQGVHFTDSSSTRKNVTKNLIMHAEHNYFDGLFLDLHDTHLNSFYFEQFVKELRQEIEERVERFKKPPMMLVLAVRAQDAFHANRKVKAYADKFDAFYLKGDEALSAMSDVTTTLTLDPLYTDVNTPFEDVISRMATSLTMNGIPEQKLVIGFSANARGYSLASRNETWHGAFAYEYARLNGSLSKNGRFAFQEICQLPGFENIEYWNKSVAISFVDDNDNWFSFNMPDHESMERKVKYAMNHGFGGIGLSNIEADDPNDVCNKGAYPLHKFIAQRLQCNKRTYQHGGTTECKRMCIYRPEHGQISFQNFKPEWCSHYVVSSVGFNDNGTISEPKYIKDAIVNYNTWPTPQKPYLVLSIGAEKGRDDWQRVLDDNEKRKHFIASIWQFYKDNNADGISIDFVKEGVASSPEEKDAKENLMVFLEELKKEKPNRNAVIFFTASFESTTKNYYDFVRVRNNVDYVIIEGYRFIGLDSKFTGHHSPLFGNSTILQGGSQNSIEGMAAMWTKTGLPHNRTILGFSAAALTMNIIQKDDGPATKIMDVHETKFIGLEIDKSDVQVERSMGAGMISQTELQKGKAIHQFIHEIGVPVARKGNSYYSYDDARSIQTKSIWASLNHFAGVSLHAIEMDNPESRCPSKEPFNLLQKIVHTQACEACARPTQLAENFLVDTDSCQPKPFRIICNYQLPKVEITDNSVMSAELIPFEKCDEVVVEEVLLMPNGHLTFHNTQEQLNLNKLAEQLRIRPHLKKQVYLIVRCQMTSAELKDVLEHTSITAETVLSKLNGVFHFSGIELRCDQAINNATRPHFMKFVEDIKAVFESRKEVHKRPCAETVAIRVPIWNNNLTEKYDIDQLNSVHQVVLETFEHKATHARVVSPLYGFDKSDETHSIDATIAEWVQAGIHREKIIMQLPTYGLVQTFAEPNAHHQLNDTTMDYFNLISQTGLCWMFNQKDNHHYQQHILYDMLASYAVSNTKWISYETAETVTYKVKFAIREGLGGVGLLNLNQEDYHGACGPQTFGLLNAVHASICPAPASSD